MLNLYIEERAKLENAGILKSDLDFAEKRRECTQVYLSLINSRSGYTTTNVSNLEAFKLEILS